jgi:hypothetical protein
LQTSVCNQPDLFGLLALAPDDVLTRRNALSTVLWMEQVRNGILLDCDDTDGLSAACDLPPTHITVCDEKVRVASSFTADNRNALAVDLLSGCCRSGGLWQDNEIALALGPGKDRDLCLGFEMRWKRE